MDVVPAADADPLLMETMLAKINDNNDLFDDVEPDNPPASGSSDLRNTCNAAVPPLAKKRRGKNSHSTDKKITSLIRQSIVRGPHISGPQFTHWSALEVCKFSPQFTRWSVRKSSLYHSPYFTHVKKTLDSKKCKARLLSSSVLFSTYKNSKKPTIAVSLRNTLKAPVLAGAVEPGCCWG